MIDLKNHILPSHKSEFDKKFDELFGVRFKDLNLNLINTLALKCPTSLLPILANSFDINTQGLNEGEARELIHDAFIIHYYSGTFYSLSKALKSFYSQSSVIEWHEYNGEPYHFKLELEASKTGIDKTSLNKTDEIVNTYKNVRSVYDGVTIKIATRSNTNVGSYLMQGETIEVMPFLLRELEAKAGFNHASTFKLMEIINLNLDLRGGGISMKEEQTYELL